MIDFQKLPSPCFVLDEQLLDRNLAAHRPRSPGERCRSDRRFEGLCHVEYFPGACATFRRSHGAFVAGQRRGWFSRSSGRPGAHVRPGLHGPEYRRDPAIAATTSRSTPLAQFRTVRPDGPAAAAFRAACGSTRGYSPVETDLYNPCVPGSRLGVTANSWRRTRSCPPGWKGLHFHSCCASLAPSICAWRSEAVEKRFGTFPRPDQNGSIWAAAT